MGFIELTKFPQIIYTNGRLDLILNSNGDVVLI